MPTVPIVVGLWPPQDPILKNEDLRKAVGADHYTSSLHETVEICVEAAQIAPAAKPRLAAIGASENALP